MRNNITAFYVENFKAIGKGTWFELKDLNILTGANNSGKSTLFKAMKIFTDGFQNSDFPEIDLKDLQLIGGIFEQIINFNSKTESFKLGFRYHSNFFNKEADLIYTFVPGDYNAGIKVKEATLFIDNIKLMQIFLSANEDKPFNHEPILHDWDDPSTFTIGIHLVNFLKYLDKSLKDRFELLLSYLRKSFGKIWILEAVNTDRYQSQITHHTRFAELIYYDLAEDFYCNFITNDSKSPIMRNGDKTCEQEYKTLCIKMNYTQFLELCLRPIFNELSSNIRFFYQKRLFHLDYSIDFQERVIRNEHFDPIINLLREEIANLTIEQPPELEKRTKELDKPDINKLYQERAYNRCEGRLDYSSIFNYLEAHADVENPFMWRSTPLQFVALLVKSLNSFNIKGSLVVKNYLNAALSILFYDGKNYISTGDLGRGHARLIQMILLIASKILIQISKDNRREENETNQIIIHIEEPEAYLHPKWQSLLADYFVFITNLYDVQFLIETHSEYLVRKLQYLVAKGEFKAENVSIFYFEEPEVRKGKPKKPLFRNISLDENGRMSQDFGPGFFDEADNIAIQLFNLNQQSNN